MGNIDIYIDDIEKEYNIEEEKIKKIIETTLKKCIEIENLRKDIIINVEIVEDERIKEINNSTRNIDKVTDVLSFPMYEKKDFEEKLVGPTAVITCKSDYLATSKVIYNFIKENDYYTLKAGMIEGEVKTKEEIFTLAQLPSREELLSKLAGVLLANISKLAVALDQVKQQKESGVEPEVKEEAKEEVKEEEKTEQE